MSFVIATGCCNDASCVDVCPVDCIRPRPGDPEFRTAEQLYIDPASCIECSACMYACPVSAIHDERELPAHLAEFAAVNADYFAELPLQPRYVGVPEQTESAPVRASVAVIGSGPAGCYAVAALSDIPGIDVTLVDRLPTPFGLLRAGVAPDHPDTKLVGDYFESVLDRPQVSCRFNVNVGTDITLEEVRAAHHAVVYAGGAPGDRPLGIPGESLAGSASAREFVSWYNGHPASAARHFDLTGRMAVVIGNGNVALDVARVLTRPADAMAATDMADHATAALAASHIGEVIIVGRRGPADAACTFPELLELSRLDAVDVRVPPDDLAVDPDRHLTVDQQRKLDLFRRLADDGRPTMPGARRITFRFNLTPSAITGDSEVEAISLRTPAGSTEVLSAGLVLRAVGYAVAPVDGLPFDLSTGTLSHRGGRIVDDSAAAVTGLYCAGWAKRGPSGVIGTNKACSRETVGHLVDDLRAGLLPAPTMSAEAFAALIGERRPDHVDLTGWHAIDVHEREAGQAASPAKPRRKLVEVARMLAAARVVTPSTPREERTRS